MKQHLEGKIEAGAVEPSDRMRASAPDGRSHGEAEGSQPSNREP